MSTIDELKKVRLEKLKSLQDSGVLVYPAKTKRTHGIFEIVNSFEKFKTKNVVVVGRIMSIRSHGSATFFDVQDGSDDLESNPLNEDKELMTKIQILLNENKVGEKGYKFFIDHFDVGDFIEVSGIVTETKRGERTIEAEDYKILAKSLLPLPSEKSWNIGKTDERRGFQDEDENLRKRYIDILFNPDKTRQMIKQRAVFWNSMREFLVKKGFLEVETPVLEVTPGGADARPFVTHHNALDLDVYLRISMGELWQKKLMVAGFEKTFEIGRMFRNEGMDAEHLQDYTHMEF